jgi:hypothetical protein
VIRKEKELITQLLFNKTPFHKVKYLPFDYSWGIYNEFNPVLDALIKLSSVLIAFSLHTFEDKHAKFIVEHMRFISTTLKNGLISLGCSNPPKHVDAANINKDTILEIAKQINESILQTSCEKTCN